MNDEKIESVKYMGVEISRVSVAKVAGARTEWSIPRHEIYELRIQYGYPGERRLLQLALGTLLLGGAAWLMLQELFWFLGGGEVVFVRFFVIFVVLLGIGGWLVRDATLAQWYIEVETQEKTRKLAFDEKIDDAHLSMLLSYAKEMGYTVDAAVFEARAKKQPGKAS
jgi:hypothetical protein